MKHTGLITTISVIVAAILLIYVSYDAIGEKKVEKEDQLRGEGYSAAISQLLQAASQCQPVPVTFDNVTLNLIAVECPAMQELQILPQLLTAEEQQVIAQRFQELQAQQQAGQGQQQLDGQAPPAQDNGQAVAEE